MKILFIDDNVGDRVLVKEILTGKFDGSLELDTVGSAADAYLKLGNNKFDIVLLDYRLGEMNGLEVLDEFKMRGITTPVIFLTGQGNEEVAVEVLAKGAYDYFTKDNITSDRLVQSIININKRKKAEEGQAKLIAELESKNAELERFTYTVSHDLKSPLVTIKGFLGMLEKDALDGNIALMREDIARISHAADKMYQLLGEILDLSRIGHMINQPEHIPLYEISVEAVELVAGQIASRGVDVVISPDLPVVCGDRPRLLEVMQNLLDNAVKFMGEQTRPYVEVGAEEVNGEYICFVRDNGIGIEPLYQSRVFGLFDKLDMRTEGSGVGLALVKRIIEVHKGRIWLESEGKGKGSTFYFALPKNGVLEKHEQRADIGSTCRCVAG